MVFSNQVFFLLDSASILWYAGSMHMRCNVINVLSICVCMFMVCVRVCVMCVCE